MAFSVTEEVTATVTVPERYEMKTRDAPRKAQKMQKMRRAPLLVAHWANSWKDWGVLNLELRKVFFELLG